MCAARTVDSPTDGRGVLNMLSTNQLVTFELNSSDPEYTETRNLQTAMLQTWNKRAAGRPGVAM